MYSITFSQFFLQVECRLNFYNSVAHVLWRVVAATLVQYVLEVHIGGVCEHVIIPIASLPRLATRLFSCYVILEVFYLQRASEIILCFGQIACQVPKNNLLLKIVF